MHRVQNFRNVKCAILLSMYYSARVLHLNYNIMWPAMEKPTTRKFLWNPCFIDAEFSVEFNGKKKNQDPKWFLGRVMAKKIYTGHPFISSQFFDCCTTLNVQCFRIRSVSYRALSELNRFAGKEDRDEPCSEINIKRTLKSTPHKFYHCLCWALRSLLIWVWSFHSHKAVHAQRLRYNDYDTF